MATGMTELNHGTNNGRQLFCLERATNSVHQIGKKHLASCKPRFKKIHQSEQKPCAPSFWKESVSYDTLLLLTAIMLD